MTLHRGESKVGRVWEHWKREQLERERERTNPLAHDSPANYMNSPFLSVLHASHASRIGPLEILKPGTGSRRSSHETNLWNRQPE